MELIRTIFDRVGAPVLIGFFLFLFFAESRWQLRKRVQSRIKRIRTNAIVAIGAFLFLRLAFIPAVVWLAVQNKNDWQIGLNFLWPVPYPAAFLVGFILLDYSNYLWHILLHKIGLLWRFHLVHHTDLDLDVTTAVRFHFGELIASILYRGAVVLVIGASPLLVIVYEICFEAATNFHHSNWKLPERLEKWLNLFIVTPRMHGIHHSIVKQETDSNYAVIFSFWDRLHKTAQLQIPQEELSIGVPSYRNEQELTPWKLLLMPFTGKPRAWKLPDGTVPKRNKKQKQL